MYKYHNFTLVWYKPENNHIRDFIFNFAKKKGFKDSRRRSLICYDPRSLIYYDFYPSKIFQNRVLLKLINSDYFHYPVLNSREIIKYIIYFSNKKHE